MGDCELLKGCLFFNDKMPMATGMGAIYKKKYCQGDNSKCARYRVAKQLGREFVPTDLFPNMFEAAEKIIRKGLSKE